MITSLVPNTWQDLQRDVGRILAECGFSVDLERTMATVRGEVEIDVYAVETVNGRQYSILCECKLWRRRVPKSTINAFSTVVSNIGANVGYVVSINGFQSGAFAASRMTNLELVTWTEFQLRFETSWYEAYFIPLMSRTFTHLVVRVFSSAWVDDLSLQTRDAISTLQNKYMPFAQMLRAFVHPWILTGLNDYSGIPMPNFYTLEHGAIKYSYLDLPVIGHFKLDPEILDRLPADLLIAVGYREFYASALRYCNEAMREFQSVLGDVPLVPEGIAWWWKPPGPTESGF